MSTQVVANAEVQAHMSVEEIANVAEHLWAVDCQLCNGPLGAKPPSLLVYETTPELVTAALAHTRCSPPAWFGEADPIRWVPSAATVSWRAGGAMIPAERLDAAEVAEFEATMPVDALPGNMLPALVVNPAMESINVRREGGRWLVDLAPELYPFKGWQDLAAEPVGTNLLGGAAAMIEGEHVCAGTERNARMWWAGCKEDRFWNLLEVSGGLLLVITHAIDPHTMESAELVAMRDPGASLAGWVRLAGR